MCLLISRTFVSLPVYVPSASSSVSPAGAAFTAACRLPTPGCTSSRRPTTCGERRSTKASGHVSSTVVLWLSRAELALGGLGARDSARSTPLCVEVPTPCTTEGGDRGAGDGGIRGRGGNESGIGEGGRGGAAGGAADGAGDVPVEVAPLCITLAVRLVKTVCLRPPASNPSAKLEASLMMIKNRKARESPWLRWLCVKPCQGPGCCKPRFSSGFSM